MRRSPTRTRSSRTATASFLAANPMACHEALSSGYGDYALCIPMPASPVRSLNLATAVGIVLYEGLPGSCTGEAKKVPPRLVEWPRLVPIGKVGICESNLANNPVPICPRWCIPHGSRRLSADARGPASTCAEGSGRTINSMHSANAACSAIADSARKAVWSAL